MSATAVGTAMLVAPLPLPAPVPGLYVRARAGGFTAHITACAGTLRTVRGLVAAVLTAYGVGGEAVESAQLVLSELVGNAVRAGGEHVPLVVEVYRAADGVQVVVHDPVAERLPHRGAPGLDSAEAESGRGLLLLDVLAPGWSVVASPVGKHVRCRIGA